MKNDLLDIVKKCLEKEREKLLIHIKKITIARDGSPLPTESHSDTSRIQADNFLSELKVKLKELDGLIRDLPKDMGKNDTARGLWSYHEINKNGSKLKIILVPNGYGGRETEGIKLVSINTPIARSILET